MESEKTVFLRYTEHLNTLPLDDGRSIFAVFLLGNPHVLEALKGGQYGCSNPHTVFPLWRSNKLTCVVDGTRTVISFFNLSAKTGYMVLPPDRAKLAYKALWMFISHCMMKYKWYNEYHMLPFPKSKDGRVPLFNRTSRYNGYHATTRQFLRLLQ